MKIAYTSLLGILLLVTCHAASAGGQHLRMISKPAVHADTQDAMVGTASFYAKHFHGKYTASGQRYDKDGFTAAHPYLPFGTKVKVVNLRNRRMVVVTVNDRGGFDRFGRIIDVSRAAASELGMVRRGTAKVKLEVIKN